MSQLASIVMASLHDDVMKAIHEQRYKNGAFIEPIPKTTPILKAIVLLVASPHTSSDEKGNLRNFAEVYVKAAREFSGAGQDAKLLVPLMAGPIQELFEMFDKDFEAQARSGKDTGSTTASST